MSGLDTTNGMHYAAKELNCDERNDAAKRAKFETLPLICHDWMTNRRGLGMKMTLALCVPVLLISLLSCSKSTDPEENSPTEDAFELVATAEIGPGGGVLTAEGFEVTISPGALDATHSLALYIDTRDVPLFGGRGVTPLYKIEGLAGAGFVRMHASIRYEGELAGTSGIALGRNDYEEGSEADEAARFFAIEDASISGGNLEADLIWEGLGGGERSNLPAEFAFVWGISNFFVERIGNFEYRYDYRYPERVVLLSLLLDAELAILLEDWELNFISPEFDWPIKINVFEPYDFDGDGELDIFDKVRYSTSGRWLPSFPLSVSILIPTTDIDPEIDLDLPEKLGSMLIRLYQENSEGFETGGWNDPSDRVLHEAFIDWSGEEFTINPALDKPRQFAGKELYPLDGILAPIETSRFPWDQGHGIAPLAKFLMDDARFGVDGYRTAWEQVRLNVPMMDAIKAEMSDPIEVWLTEFFIEYFQGEIYGVDPQLLIGQPIAQWAPATGSEQFSLNNDNPTAFPDLSAKVIAIDLAQEYEAGTSLKVQVTSDEVNDDRLSLILFAKEGSGLRYLGHGFDWTLPQLQGGGELIAVVVNASHALNYMGSSELYVTMELDQSLSFTVAEVELTMNTWEQLPDWEDPFYHPASGYNWRNGRGEISGTQFSVPIDHTTGGTGNYVYHVGHIEGVVNEDFTTLISLTAEVTLYIYENDVHYSTGFASTTISGPISNIPGFPGHWLVEGADTCGHVDSFISTSSGGFVSWITAWSCDESSELFIGLF